MYPGDEEWLLLPLDNGQFLLPIKTRFLMLPHPTIARDLAHAIFSTCSTFIFYTIYSCPQILYCNSRINEHSKTTTIAQSIFYESRPSQSVTINAMCPRFWDSSATRALSIFSFKFYIVANKQLWSMTHRGCLFGAEYRPPWP